MNELLKINYETEQPTVSARDLHEKLEISKRFSVWFETNSKGFVEGQHWLDRQYGYLEWDRYSNGHGGCSLYKVTAWMPLPKLYKG